VNSKALNRMDLVNEYSPSNNSSSSPSESSDDDSENCEEREIRHRFAQAPIVNADGHRRTTVLNALYTITRFTFVVPHFTKRQVSQCESAAQDVWSQLLHEDGNIAEKCVFDKDFVDNLSGELKYHISTSYNLTFRGKDYKNTYKGFMARLQQSLKSINDLTIKIHEPIRFNGEIKLFISKDGTALFLAAIIDKNTCQNLAPLVKSVNSALLDTETLKYDPSSLHMSIGRITFDQTSMKYNNLSALSLIKQKCYYSQSMVDLDLRFGEFDISDGRKLVRLL